MKKLFKELIVVLRDIQKDLHMIAGLERIKREVLERKHDKVGQFDDYINHLDE